MSVFRISTDSVPPAQRREYVEEHFAAIRRISLDFDDASPISFDMSMRALPGMKVAITSFSPYRSSGLSQQDEEFGDVIFLGLTASGAPRFSQNGCESDLTSHCARLEESGKPFFAAMGKPGSILGILTPRKDLAARVKDLDAAFRQTIMACPATRLLASYASEILHTETSSTLPEEEALYAAHVSDLMLLALGGARADDAEIAQSRGVRAALFARLKADIDSNVANPELSLGWLARRHGYSPHTMRKLFYAAGTSFRDHVLEARLGRAKAMLSDLHFHHMNVIEIAHEAGFGDISWFNKAFRHRFGMTPSDLRALQAEQ